MPNNRKCCDKVVNCYDDRRQPADRISTDRIDIAVKTIQNISITILINLHPVGIDDLIKNIRLNIIIDIDTQFCRNTSNHISNRKTKKCTSKCDQDHDPQLTHLISCDDIDHIFTCHTSNQSHGCAENTKDRVESDRSFISFAVGKDPFPVVNDL